jgi:hypothetical protein
MLTRAAIVCAFLLLGALALLCLLLRGIGRLDRDVLPTDDEPPAQPPERASVSQDWLDHIDSHRFVECAFTDVEHCKECAWLVMFSIVCERMFTGQANLHRTTFKRPGGAR